LRVLSVLPRVFRSVVGKWEVALLRRGHGNRQRQASYPDVLLFDPQMVAAFDRSSLGQATVGNVLFDGTIRWLARFDRSCERFGQCIDHFEPEWPSTLASKRRRSSGMLSGLGDHPAILGVLVALQSKFMTLDLLEVVTGKLAEDHGFSPLNLVLRPLARAAYLAQAGPASRHANRGSLPACSQFHPIAEFSSQPTSPPVTSPPGSDRSSADPRVVQESSRELPMRVLLCPPGWRINVRPTVPLA
jgi:hypothetical protein